MPTYADIDNWVREHHCFAAQPCWISECKAEALGLENPHLNRDGSPRKKQMKQPLSKAKRDAILKAFSAIGIPNGKSD